MTKIPDNQRNQEVDRRMLEGLRDYCKEHPNDQESLRFYTARLSEYKERYDPKKVTPEQVADMFNGKLLKD